MFSGANEFPVLDMFHYACNRQIILLCGRIITFLLCFSTMQNTEGGRKLNQAMVSTGRAVATTGRAVGEYCCSV